MKIRYPRIKRPLLILTTPVLALVVMLQLFQSIATAATFTVTNTNDSGAGSLRAAVLETITNPGPDRITFDSSLDGATILLLSGPLVLSSTMTIDAANLPGGIQISGNDTDRVFYIEPFAAVTLTHLSLISGTTQFGSGSCNEYCGGAIYAGFDSQVVIQESEIRGNRANGGGGIFNEGEMHISDSIISDNSADYEAGGIRNSGRMTIMDSSIISNSTKLDVGGGGIFADFFSELSLMNSTVAYNHAKGAGGGILGYTSAVLNVNQSTIAHNSATTSGGGLSLGSSFENTSSSVEIVNSTISNNTAGGPGGGIYSSAMLTSTMIMTVTHATIFSNTAPSVGGIYQTADATSTTAALIQNSIVAGSGGSNCLGVSGGQDNTADDDSCTGFRQGSPLLGPLTNNGGSTATHALIGGGPPVGMGDPAVCQSVGVDQRGIVRSQPVCDAGAFENTTDFLYRFIPFTQAE